MKKKTVFGCTYASAGEVLIWDGFPIRVHSVIKRRICQKVASITILLDNFKYLPKVLKDPYGPHRV